MGEAPLIMCSYLQVRESLTAKDYEYYQRGADVWWGLHRGVSCGGGTNRLERAVSDNMCGIEVPGDCSVEAENLVFRREGSWAFTVSCLVILRS